MTEQSNPGLVRRVARFARRFALPILVVVLLGILGGAFEAGRYSVYSAYPELSKVEKTNEILEKVGALIQLPANEAPSMATIDDAEAVKKVQPFLTNAQNGDILIVYQSAAEALLYRPSTNKLIAVGPVTSGTGNPAAPQQQAQSSDKPASTSTPVKNVSTSTPAKR